MRVCGVIWFQATVTDGPAPLSGSVPPPFPLPAPRARSAMHGWGEDGVPPMAACAADGGHRPLPRGGGARIGGAERRSRTGTASLQTYTFSLASRRSFGSVTLCPQQALAGLGRVGLRDLMPAGAPAAAAPAAVAEGAAEAAAAEAVARAVEEEAATG